MKKLINELNDMRLAFMLRARESSGPTPSQVAYGSFLNAETCRKAAEELQRCVEREAEYEGDARSSWWYVCPECHGGIIKNQHYCKNCGQKLKWTELKI